MKGTAASTSTNTVTADSPPQNVKDSQQPEHVGAAVAELVGAATSKKDDVAGIAVLSDEQEDSSILVIDNSNEDDNGDFHNGDNTNYEPSSLAPTDENKTGEKRKAPLASTSEPVGTADAAADTSAEPAPPAKQTRRSPPVRVSWDDRMEMLRAYKAQHRNLLIPIRYKLNPSLGKFVHNTREQYKLFHHKCKAGYKKKCSLTAERIQQLQDIGFVFTTERTKRQNEDWESRFEQLKQYKEKHGDCLVPHGYTEDPSFAEWIHRQRTAHAANTDSGNFLVEERMKKLLDLGFVFTVHSDKWMDHFKQLQAYKEKHGHCQVPTHYSENPKLGRWVHTQRHQRRLQLKSKKSCMTLERIHLLDQLEFSWEVRPSLVRPRATWQQRLEELRDFHQQHGHFLVSDVYHPQLHSWCLEQKQRLKYIDKSGGEDSSKRMGPDRVKALAELGFTKTVQLGPASSETAAPAAVDDDSAEEPTIGEAPATMVETVADPVKCTADESNGKMAAEREIVDV